VCAANVTGVEVRLLSPIRDDREPVMIPFVRSSPLFSRIVMFLKGLHAVALAHSFRRRMSRVDHTPPSTPGADHGALLYNFCSRSILFSQYVSERPIAHRHCTDRSADRPTISSMCHISILDRLVASRGLEQKK
jgi:hypothetical protein